MRKEKRCGSCVYHGFIPSGGVVYCDYFGITGRLRPCKCFGPGDGCELYEREERRRRRQVGLRLRGGHKT